MKKTLFVVGFATLFLISCKKTDFKMPNEGDSVKIVADSIKLDTTQTN